MKPDDSAEMGGYYFDVQRYRGSDKVRLMDHETRGIYREVLDEIWVTGSVPNNPDAIARLIHAPADVVLRAWPQIRDCLISTRDDADRFMSERMERERKRRNKVRKERAKIGAKGGLAKAENRRKRELAIATHLVQQKDSQALANSAIPIPNPIPIPTPIPKPERKGSGMRRTGAPTEFPISDEMRNWALEAGFTDLDIHRETPAMLDHFRGKGEKKLDWIATWRNWLRNSRKFGASNGNNGNGKGPKSKTELNAEAGQRALARLSAKNSGSV